MKKLYILTWVHDGKPSKGLKIEAESASEVIPLHVTELKNSIKANAEMSWDDEETKVIAGDGDIRMQTYDENGNLTNEEIFSDMVVRLATPEEIKGVWGVSYTEHKHGETVKTIKTGPVFVDTAEWACYQVSRDLINLIKESYYEDCYVGRSEFRDLDVERQDAPFGFTVIKTKINLSKEIDEYTNFVAEPWKENV